MIKVAPNEPQEIGSLKILEGGEMAASIFTVGEESPDSIGLGGP